VLVDVVRFRRVGPDEAGPRLQVSQAHRLQLFEVPAQDRDLAGLAVITIVLLYERGKNISVRQALPAIGEDRTTKEVMLPSSVRLTKFEKGNVE